MELVRVSLVAEAADEVKQNREYDAQNERCGEGKVKGSVLATMEEVSGEASEGQIGFAEEHQKQASEDDDSADEYQKFAEIGHQ
jgi:hypothetical protein